jgi:cellulose synthase (UDP-forming)
MNRLSFRGTLLVIYAAVSVAYLFWRGAYTLNWEHPVYAVVFFIAEVFSILASLAFYALIVRRLDPPVLPAPETWPGIDVLIATYNEDSSLVRTTAVAARDMHGAHRTWICDDGRRPQIEALARELGVGYLTRADNAHHKAGNLNNALAHTTGELVLVLDADHVPQPQLLQRLLPYFRDPKLALVQTPQVFYNIDSYQHDVSARKRRLWHEASVFHHLMQPGANSRGASFFVGTGAILRRSALREIGGFATGSITEDIHTSMRLHAAGYRSLYVDEALGYLLAPDTPYAFANQRLRWAQGAMQILRRENPLRKPGLSFWQRVGYMNSLGGYLAAYQHLLFYLAPALFLAFGLSPIAVDPRFAFPVFVGHIILDVAIYKILARPHARLFLSECYKILSMALHIRASFTLIQPDGLPFRVTPKGRHSGLPPSLLLPPAILFALNLTAVGLGVSRLMHGDAYPGAVLLTTFFAGLFAIAGALALVHAYECRTAHEAFTFPVGFKAKLMHAHEQHLLSVCRINHHTAYALGTHVVEPGEIGQIDLTAVGIPWHVEARVQGSERSSQGTVIKLALLNLTPAECDRLDRYVFNRAVPQLFAGLTDAPTRARLTLSPNPQPVTREAMPLYLQVRSRLL